MARPGLVMESVRSPDAVGKGRAAGSSRILVTVLRTAVSGGRRLAGVLAAVLVLSGSLGELLADEAGAGASGMAAREVQALLESGGLVQAGAGLADVPGARMRLGQRGEQLGQAEGVVFGFHQWACLFQQGDRIRNVRW